MTVKIRFPTLDEIRARAYEIYLTRGSGRSHELDDWLQAEYELMQLPLHKIAELEATAIESNHLKLFSLARVALTLQQRSPLRPKPNRREPPWGQHPIVRR